MTPNRTMNTRTRLTKDTTSPGSFHLPISARTDASPRERDYLRAMAELGPGPHRSGDIASVLGVDVRSVAPIRGGLIRKGMVYSPQHGDTAFTVPMFDAFMKRSMRGWKPARKRAR